MREVELFFLNKLGEAADPAGSESARRRLYPEPVSSEAKRKHGEGSDSIKDWLELVLPELENAFSEALSRVAKDLEKTQTTVKKGERIYELHVPAEHAEQWYSALNQARLVLAEKFGLPMDEEDFFRKGSQIDERWLASAQSNLYAFIQSFLVETVMS